MNVSSFPKLERALNSRLLACLLIVLTCAVIYSNSLDGPFILDDGHVIRDSEKIRDVSNFLRFDQSVMRRPFADLTLALNYRFGQLHTRGYHLINILIHMINGVIVYFLSGLILSRLLKPTDESSSISNLESRGVRYKASIPLIALFTALIFVAHPIQTQAVAYICQRYASLAALFYMLSVLFYLKGRMVQRSSIPRKITGENMGQQVVRPSRSGLTLRMLVLYSLCILSGILAFLSKQTAASLPLAILLVEVMCIDSSWAGWKKKLPWLGLALLFLVVAVFLLSGKPAGTGVVRGAAGRYFPGDPRNGNNKPVELSVHPVYGGYLIYSFAFSAPGPECGPCVSFQDRLL